MTHAPSPALRPSEVPGKPAGSALGDRVRQVVADVFQLEVDQVALDSSPQTIDQWDSVNHLNLVLALESEFGTSFTPEVVDHLDSVLAIVQALEGKARPTVQQRDPSGVEPVIRPLRPADLGAVVALLSRRDGQAYEEGTSGRYLCGLDPRFLLGWVALSSDRPVGMTMLYLREVLWGGEILRGGYWAHLYVHEDFRRQLLYSRLVHTMLEEGAASGVNLIYTAMRRQSVADAHVSLGFEPVATLGVQVKPLRPFALLARYRGWRLLEPAGRPLDRLYGSGLAMGWRRDSSRIQVEHADSSSRHLEVLLSMLERQAGPRIRQRWTPQSWRSRFAATLEGWPYALLVAREGDEVLGGLLMRIAVRAAPVGRSSIRLGVLMDIVAPQGREAVAARLVGEAERRAIREGCQAMLWLDGVMETGPLMAKLGYRASSETYRIIVWPPSRVPADSPARSVSHWRFPFSEHDAF